MEVPGAGPGGARPPVGGDAQADLISRTVMELLENDMRLDPGDRQGVSVDDVVSSMGLDDENDVYSVMDALMTSGTVYEDADTGRFHQRGESGGSTPPGPATPEPVDWAGEEEEFKDAMADDLTGGDIGEDVADPLDAEHQRLDEFVEETLGSLPEVDDPLEADDPAEGDREQLAREFVEAEPGIDIEDDLGDESTSEELEREHQRVEAFLESLPEVDDAEPEDPTIDWMGEEEGFSDAMADDLTARLIREGGETVTRDESKERVRGTGDPYRVTFRNAYGASAQVVDRYDPSEHVFMEWTDPTNPRRFAVVYARDDGSGPGMETYPTRGGAEAAASEWLEKALPAEFDLSLAVQEFSEALDTQDVNKLVPVSHNIREALKGKPFIENLAVIEDPKEQLFLRDFLTGDQVIDPLEFYGSFYPMLWKIFNTSADQMSEPAIAATETALQKLGRSSESFESEAPDFVMPAHMYGAGQIRLDMPVAPDEVRPKEKTSRRGGKRVAGSGRKPSGKEFQQVLDDDFFVKAQETLMEDEGQQNLLTDVRQLRERQAQRDIEQQGQQELFPDDRPSESLYKRLQTRLREADPPPRPGPQLDLWASRPTVDPDEGLSSDDPVGGEEPMNFDDPAIWKGVGGMYMTSCPHCGKQFAAGDAEQVKGEFAAHGMEHGEGGIYNRPELTEDDLINPDGGPTLGADRSPASDQDGSPERASRESTTVEDQMNTEGYPRVVRWVHGDVETTMDLKTGQKSERKLEGQRYVKNPATTLKVLARMTDPPGEKAFKSGGVTLNLTDDGKVNLALSADAMRMHGEMAERKFSQRRRSL